MKRYFALNLFLALALLLLAACTQPAPQVIEKTVVVTQIVPQEVVKTVEVDKPAIPAGAKLTAWILQSYVEGVDAYQRSQMDDFTKLTGIPVDVTYVNPDEASVRYNAALEAPETLPDIIQFDAVWFPLFQEAGRLVDVSDVVAAVNQDAGGINPALVQGVTVDGKQFAIPWMADAMASYFRTDVFKKAGVQVPTTWQELLDACPKVNKPGEMYCVGLNIHGFGDSEEFSRALIWSFGGAATDPTGKVATINSPETIAALNYIKTLAAQGSFPPDFATSDDGTNNQWFETGTVAFTVNSGSVGAWLAANAPDMYENTLMTVPLANEKGDRQIAIDPMTLAITTNTKYPDQAKMLIEYITNSKNSWAYIEATNYAHVSVYTGLVNMTAIQEDPHRLGLAQTMLYSRYDSWPAPFTSAATDIYSNRVLSQMLENVMTGTMTPEQAAADAQTKVEAILAKYK
jgi:ABC-type glycerol-3-phosphate transport system substrate-binding protein